MVKVVGFALPDKSPDQWSNPQYVELLAVRVTTLLLGYGPVGGVKLTVPLPLTVVCKL
jgi:hypothetical protein